VVTRALALALCLAAGCSGSGPSAADAGGDAGDGSGELDLSRAEWELSAAGEVSPGYAGGASLAFGDGGAAVAWFELDTGDPGGDRPVFVSREAADFAADAVTPEAGANFTGTAIAAGADALHLVFNGTGASGESEIFYARDQGGGWEQPVDLTGPLETVARRDTEPQVLVAGDEIVVAYLSATIDDALSPGIHLLRFPVGGAPGAVEPLIDSAGSDCEDIDAVVGPSGSIHIAAECRMGEGDSEIIYLTDRSGAFVQQSAALGTGETPRNPAVAIGADGAVHLVWSASGDCGGVTCRDVFYSRQLAPAVSVTGGSQDGGDFPGIAGLPGGEIVVAFHRTAGDGDLFWTYADSGAAFVRVQSATPGTRETLEYFVSDLAVDPDGHPQMVFIRDFRTSDPIEADVYRGVLR
jgi:hypothetical protein